MHSASVNSIDVDASENFLVTASDDKTARIWAVRDSKLLRTLRPPEGPGIEGMLYAVAISPNGSTVAVGEYTGPEIGPTCIYFYDRADGRLVHAIGGLPDTTDHLAYSADGRYLAVALNHASGVRVYRSSDYAEVGRDASYGDASTWVEFDRNGRLLTASDDGFVRAYDSRFHLTGRFEPPGGNWIQSARFSPDASKVAVGFTDSAAINVLSGRDLSFLYAPDTHFSNQSLGTHAGLVA